MDKQNIAKLAQQRIDSGFCPNSVVRVITEGDTVKLSKPISFEEYNQKFDVAPNDCFSLFSLSRGLAYVKEEVNYGY